MSRNRLDLEAAPQSVREARAWVTQELERIDRADLAEAAELGVSELVTNAILHAEPPITVRVRGSRTKPRVEVHDHSTRPPRTGVDMTDEDHLLATIGRGMGIVGLYSVSWGADVSPDGKVVWFVPSGDPGVDVAEHGDVYDLGEAVEQAMGRVPRQVRPDEPMVRIRLLGMPAQVFASFRAWYSEVRRELRLLSFEQGARYPVAEELGTLILQTEHERRLSSGVERLNQAIRAGERSVDLEYVVPRTSPDTMARLDDVLVRADRFCRDQSLLTMPATPQQLELLHWYTGEFVRQGRGEPPRAWPGSNDVDPTTG